MRPLSSAQRYRRSAAGARVIDPIAVELSNAQVAFLAHEVLWGFDPDCTDFEDCVARSTLDIDTFWERALAWNDFPADFYAARGE
jgi:hypothetical protein